MIGTMTPQDPPWLSHLFFEQPTPLIMALGLAGLILLWHGNRRLNRRVMAAGAGCFLLAGASWLLAWAVVTPREQVIENTRALVAHTAPLNLPAVRALFDPAATLTNAKGEHWLRFEQIFARLEAVARTYALASNELAGVAAEATSSTRGLAEIEVRSTLGGEYGQLPVQTRWLLHWEKGVDGRWRVVEVQWLRIGNVEPSRGMAW